MADGQIAAIAAVHGFTMATRDTGPFVAAGVPVVNPWEVGGQGGNPDARHLGVVSLRCAGQGTPKPTVLPINVVLRCLSSAPERQ